MSHNPPNGHRNKSTALSQAILLQRQTAEVALKADTKPSILAALVRSWCLVDARISAHRMKPLPKSVDAAAWRAQVKRSKRKATLDAADEPAQAPKANQESGVSKGETEKPVKPKLYPALENLEPPGSEPPPPPLG